MLYEKCAGETESITCPHCGCDIAKFGPFCYACGKEFVCTDEAPAEDDFSKRILCSDGACIGVIDEKGICKVCEKPYSPES